MRRAAAYGAVCLVVCGFKLPDGACAYLRDDLAPGCAMLMLAPQHQLDLCQRDGICGLPAPASRNDLTASVRMLLGVQHPAASRCRGEEDRSAISRAKSLLMHRNGMTEAQAHRFLQKQSMDSRTTLTETALRLLADT